MKKKRKLWVKLAALTLALALLWMNMADVRNIVNANAEGDDGGDEQITAVVSLDGETVADDGDVTITVTTNHAVGGVMISIGAEDSAPETVDGFASNEDKMIWKKTLSMKEHGWAAGAKVSIFSVTDGDGNLISVESGNCSFTVEEKSVDPDPEEDPFTVTVEGFDDTQPTVKDTVKLTVITSSAADRVEIVLGVEGSDEPIPVEEDSVKDAGDGKTWTVELPVSKYEEWTVGTKVYVSSVTATKDEKTVNGIVSNSEDDESSVSAENAMYSFTVAEEEGNPGEDGNEPDDSKEDPEKDGKKDVDTPVIGEEIKLDKQGVTLKDGETVIISGTAYDMGSGIDRIEINVNGYRKGTIYADYDAETLEWKAVLTVSKENFYNRKKIYISSVKAVDKGELYKK